jgi:uncharacterized membrane-anchored protein
MTRLGRMLFVALVLIQVVVIVGMAAGRESTLRQEETDIKLQTVPVDPRDLFRGDYVVLRYEISTIGTAGLDSSVADLKRGDTVYVALVEGGDGHWVVSDVATAPDESWGRFLRGTVVGIAPHAVDVEYGIEQYFVPEGEGLAIERAFDVDVVVAADRSGRGVIRHLIVDGTVWDPHD